MRPKSRKPLDSPLDSLRLTGKCTSETLCFVWTGTKLPEMLNMTFFMKIVWESELLLHVVR